MGGFISFLNGRKTYIGGAIVFIAGGLQAINVIDQKTFEILATLGGSIAVMGVGHKLAKLTNVLKSLGE